MHSLDRLAHATPWRLRHPAEKALLAAGLAALALLGPAPIGPGLAAGAATLVAGAAARVPWPRWAAACTAPLAIVGLTALSGLLQVNTSGVHLLPSSAVPPVLDRAWRAAGAITALVLLATTTAPTDLLAPLRRWPALHDLALAIARLIAAGDRTRQRLQRAHAARRGHARVGASAGLLLAALGRRTLQRARAQDRALEQRAGGGHWTLLAVHEPLRPAVCLGQVVVVAALFAVAGWLA